MVLAAHQFYLPTPPPRPRAELAHLRLGPIIHELITAQGRAHEVYEAWTAELAREMPGVEPLSYNAFLNRLRGLHGVFNLDDLPALLRALRLEQFDTGALWEIFATACQPDPVVGSDGQIIGETLALCRQIGEIAAHAESGPLNTFTGSELDDLLRHGGRIVQLVRSMQAEILRARAS